MSDAHDQNSEEVSKDLFMNIQESLKATIGDSSVKEVVTTVADLGINEVVDSELLEKIPVLGVLVKGIDIISTITNRIFLKKLAEFLKNIGTVSDDEKMQFWEKVEQEGDQKFGEHILFIIDRTESIDQARMVGKLFRALVLDNINGIEFEKLIRAIRNIYLSDFAFLRISPKDLQFKDTRTKEKLYHYELFDKFDDILDKNAFLYDIYPEGTKYGISELGSKFAKYVLEEEIPYIAYTTDYMSHMHDETVKSIREAN